MGQSGSIGAGAPDEIGTVATNVDGPVAFHDGGSDRYVFIGPLGVGGMGTVLRAYDAKLQREVALKQLRPEVPSASAEARLLREAQAMAKLSHPNVVAVYDVLLAGLSGAGKGVIVAMELVDGRTLKAWLAEERRSWSEIVEVYGKAGRGLAAAHAASFVHRDFKPANVLIGSSGEVKVADFGLAKIAGQESFEASSISSAAGDQSSADGTSLTETGIVMGTPRYMAPEQHAGKPTTAASDQYAFCVALWEALAGSPPFSGGDLAQAKLHDAPSWPKAASEVPSRIVDALRRGLRPKPATRWPSMEALLEVLAPPRRGVGRWPVAIVGVAVLGAAGWVTYGVSEREAQLCTGAPDQMALTWNEQQRARVRSAMLGTGTIYAPQTWSQVEQHLDDYAGGWVAQYTAACEATNLRQEQSREDLDLRVTCLDRVRGALGETVDVLAQSDPQVVERAFEVVQGLPSLSRCADLEALRADVPPPEDPSIAREVEAIRAELARARGLRRAGLYTAALDVDLDALARAEATGYGPVVAQARVSRGRCHLALGRYEDAEADLREGMHRALASTMTELAGAAAATLTSLVGYRRARPDEGLGLGRISISLFRATSDVGGQADAHDELGVVYARMGRFADAEAEHRRAIELWKSVGREGIVSAHTNLAYALFEQGRYDEAAAVQTQVLQRMETMLGPDHPDTGRARFSLANTWFAQGEYPRAEVASRQALEVFEAAVGEQHPDALMMRTTLANALHAQGRYTEAEAEHRKLLGLRRIVLGPKHPEVGVAQSNVGLCLHWQGKYAEAEREYRQAIEILESALGPDHPQVAMARDNLGMTLHVSKRHEEAVEQHRRALAIRLAQLGPNHPAVAASRDNMAYALLALGRFEESEQQARASLAIWEAVFGPSHPDVAISLNGLGEIVMAQGRFAEARDLLERARAIRDDTGAPPGFLAETDFSLAKAYWGLGDRKRAVDLATSAEAAYATGGDAYREQQGIAKEWLAEHGSGH